MLYGSFLGVVVNESIIFLSLKTEWYVRYVHLDIMTNCIEKVHISSIIFSCKHVAKGGQQTCTI